MGFIISAVFGEVEEPSLEGNIIKGLTGNAGTYEGCAPIIGDFSDLLSLEPGDVIVTKVTSEAFNAAIFVAGAIVTDHGGVASHAAILSRGRHSLRCRHRRRHSTHRRRVDHRRRRHQRIGDHAHVSAELTTPERWALLGSMAAASLVPLNSTMITVGLPDIAHDFDRARGTAALLVTSYLIVMAALQPFAGRVGDRVGNRLAVLVGLGGFTVASAGRDAGTLSSRPCWRPGWPRRRSRPR